MTKATKTKATKECCPHPLSQHNDMGCAAPLDLNDFGERDYCRCMNRVYRDLDFTGKVA